ncbi:MAG: SIMPL domain-containing protein [Chakrabartia sp.]
MRFSGIFGAAALLLASTHLAGGAAMAAIPVPASTHPTVAIGAGATEETAPDIAAINAGLNTTEPTADVAMEKNNREFAKIMAVVKKYKIDPKDLKTTGVSVGEDFEYTDEGRKPKGYVASNSLSIKVRDLTTIGALMADLVAAGANNLNGPQFALDDSEALTDKAREKAYDTAQRRASAYARKAGFKSVRLLTINEGAGEMGSPYNVYADAAAAGAEAAAEAMKAVAPALIEPGLVSETVYATFIFEMMP